MTQKTQKGRRRRVSKLRVLRRALDMTQEDLGKRVGVTEGHICNIEKGRNRPSLSTAEKLAAVFGVTINEIIGHVDIPA